MEYSDCLGFSHHGTIVLNDSFKSFAVFFFKIGISISAKNDWLEVIQAFDDILFGGPCWRGEYFWICWASMREKVGRFINEDKFRSSFCKLKMSKGDISFCFKFFWKFKVIHTLSVCSWFGRFSLRSIWKFERCWRPIIFKRSSSKILCQQKRRSRQSFQWKEYENGYLWTQNSNS